MISLALQVFYDLEDESLQAATVAERPAGRRASGKETLSPVAGCCGKREGDQ